MAVGLGRSIMAKVNLKGDDQETEIAAYTGAKETRGC